MSQVESPTPAHLQEAQSQLNKFPSKHLIRPTLETFTRISNDLSSRAFKSVSFDGYRVVDVRYALVSPDFSTKSEIVVGYSEEGKPLITFEGFKYTASMGNTDPSERVFDAEMGARLMTGLISDRGDEAFVNRTRAVYFGLEPGKSRERIINGITRVTQRIK